jgi:sulfhydrogenase subunit beta (sulfur reductase)
MTKILTENDLGELVCALSKDRILIAPCKKHGHSTSSQFAFMKFDPALPLSTNYGTTILPPKEFLLPPIEEIFQYENGKATKVNYEKTTIFGVDLDDLFGIHYLTKIFEKPVADEPYLKRRENIVIVAVDRFSPPKNIPFDLYLMKIPGSRYAAYAGTKEGQKILKSRLFKDQVVRVPAVTKKKDDFLLDPETYRAIEKSKNHPIWDELAEVCFGCGICSYVCPLCYCFETEDRMEIGTAESPKGTRCRTWDSCLLSHFAETTAGNFRPELRDRIYNWYFHKFVRMPREYGFPGCTGCNRCAIYCPAKINYRKVLEKVVADYKKKGLK